MPWCETCSRFWNPPSMNEDGSCPTCGNVIAKPHDEALRAPWHFKLLLAALILYLGYRLYQGIAWLAHHV
ncbi:MAG: hypothetical protein JWO37_1646 [Acidimicrobiales bacterium]|nr:hypothetical protein [Acidimicrobiales bacterium]